MPESILRVEKVTKTFPGVVALNRVDFDLYPGEVHVIVGENGAGKSTLIKLLSGVYPKDSGHFFVDSQPVEIDSVHKAQELGISTIYQELHLVPELTVAQNIFLGREPREKGRFGLVVDKGAVERRTQELLSSLTLEISPHLPVSALSVPQQQMVEVAKALSMEAKILIFDEPTSVLAEKETDALFRIIRVLKERGIGIIYISHRLEEISKIGDRVTVLRDGQYIGTLRLAEASINDLIRMMVGRDIKDQFPRNYREPGEIALELRGISRKGVLHDIDLRIHHGEVVGLAGLVGSGRTELARVIFGVDPPDSGEIRIFGKNETIGSPMKATNLGIAFITEDRKGLGLFQTLSVKDNITIASLRHLFPNGLIQPSKEQTVAEGYVNKLRIQTPTLTRLVRFLSGGNQQKVVLAKWLATKAKIFILDEPTRGIDVGAKQEIHRLIDELVKEGTPVLMISSELPEILGMSDRIYVMHEGKIKAEYSRMEATQEKILQSAMGRYLQSPPMQ